ncbi:metallophosphoesterase [Paenibacillus sp.]|uniref:metallophosphoesterase n=1 Tax=Paenibacillus sp. TaxID=58172 RepID=UPI002D5B98A9|nr:metallophosphoesterase [Paenibacillus sp.]HZG57610.1 metallophosphoesterase [Paenibacillus sp.]
MSVAIWVVLSIVIVYLCFILPTQWVRVVRIRAPLGLGKRIVQVSDLHVEKLRVSPERLRRLIERERPDYIFLTGDFTQRLRHVPKVDAYLRAMLAVGVPVYAVFGNHDYRLKERVTALFDLFRARGIPVLRNESLALDGFTLVGIDDWDAGHAKPKLAFADVAERAKTVVIAHDPNVTLKIHRRFDYLMCGHFHGGQFRLPFVFYIRNKGPLPRRGIVKGAHRARWGPFYISQGIGQANLNARFLLRSELTVHEL